MGWGVLGTVETASGRCCAAFLTRCGADGVSGCVVNTRAMFVVVRANGMPFYGLANRARLPRNWQTRPLHDVVLFSDDACHA